MYYFQCDYAEGCHPNIMQKLCETNLAQSLGYGEDTFCAQARERIAQACGRSADTLPVHFLVGGTQTNMIVISSILRPWQGVLAADSGHIAVHETGAVESTGHKVLVLPPVDGKITAEQIEEAWSEHAASPVKEHLVQPGMVYISFPTEIGTLYSKEELTKIHDVCKAHDLPLFVDGARLGYGLTSPSNDLTLKELTDLCDVFYIGGTKCGALLGEAVVIANPRYNDCFRYSMKQKGALLAKGRLLGIQFDTLFTDNLYFSICEQANLYAQEIREAFTAHGIPVHGASPTNQQFVLLSKKQMEYFAKDFVYDLWGGQVDGLDIVRFATSWATTRESVDALKHAISVMDC